MELFFISKFCDIMCYLLKFIYNRILSLIDFVLCQKPSIFSGRGERDGKGKNSFH